MYSQLHKSFQQGKLSKDQDRLKELLNESRTATDLYQKYYDNVLYQVAIKGKSNRYANALIDDAFAICGDPFYQMSRRRYGEAAQAFLDAFRKAVTFYPGVVYYNEYTDRVTCHVLKKGQGRASGTVTFFDNSTNPYELARQKAMYYRTLL